MMTIPARDVFPTVAFWINRFSINEISNEDEASGFNLQREGDLAVEFLRQRNVQAVFVAGEFQLAATDQPDAADLARPVLANWPPAT